MSPDSRPGPAVDTVGTGDPAVDTAGAAATETVVEPAGSAEVRPAGSAETERRSRLVLLIGMVAVLLLAGAVLLGVARHAAVTNGPLANEAFVDAPETAELIGQATEAMKTVYSYDHRSLAANEQAARAVITGPFVEEFGRVFEPVKQLAPAQQAVLTTTVAAVGVSLLQGDRARLLMMVDQRGTRAGNQQITGITGRLVVDAERVDGRWKIAGVTEE